MAKKVNIYKQLLGFTHIYKEKVKKFPRYADLRNMLGLLYYLQGKSKPLKSMTTISPPPLSGSLSHLEYMI